MYSTTNPNCLYQKCSVKIVPPPKMQTQQSEANFRAPEFEHVFKRILGKKSKNGYYQLRMLNKSFQSEFEATIDTAIVNFPEQLQSLRVSKFASQIQVLNITIPDDLEVLDELSLASPNYFRNIQKVKLAFIQAYESRTQQTKQMTISQPLILHGVNMACDSHRTIEIRGTFDVSITDCNFERAELRLIRSNNIFMKNTAFKYSLGTGLDCVQTSNATKMEDVEFLNCDGYGMYINCCDNINITGLKAENCRVGVAIYLVSGLNMINGSIYNCQHGVKFMESDSCRIQNCDVSGCEVAGIEVHQTIVSYSQVRVEKMGGSSQDILVGDGGEYTEIV